MPRALKGPTTGSMSRDQLALLGHLIGDGCTLPRHAIQYTTRELDIATEVSEIAARAFQGSLAPRIKQERTWYQVYLPATAHLTHNVRNPITTWLTELGVFGLRSHEKYVPKQVFAQSEDQIALFLRHIWATDGCINVAKNPRSHPAVYYASSSNRLASDIQALLLRLGIHARVKRSPQINKGRDQYHVVVSGSQDLLAFGAKVGAVGSRRQAELNRMVQRLNATVANTNRDIIPREVWRSYVVPAMQVMGMTSRGLATAMGTAYNGTAIFASNLSRERAYHVAETVGSVKLAQLAQSDVYWDKITSIIPDGEDEVFDLTVPGLHNFVAADMIVHNSIEQDADVVMFIYREAYYNKQSDRANLTDILIKKHRNGPIGDVELYFHPEQRRFTDVDHSHY